MITSFWLSLIMPVIVFFQSLRSFSLSFFLSFSYLSLISLSYLFHSSQAMKKLNYEWKNITPYNIRVQRRNPVTSQPVRMALQLYQVDPKSYLLDFKSLVDPGPDGVKERHSSSTDSNPSRSNSVSSSDSAFFRSLFVTKYAVAL